MSDKASNVVAARPGLEAQQRRTGRPDCPKRRPATACTPCAVPGAVADPASEPSQPLPSVYHPSLCVVVQGRKRALLGDEVYVYDPLHYLVVSMTLPMIGQIIEATPERPYLCLRIDIDPALVNELLLQLGAIRAGASRPRSRAVPGAHQRDRCSMPCCAWCACSIRRTKRAVLAPLALREIHYRVLIGELGQRLRELCDVDGPAQRVARAIELLKHALRRTAAHRRAGRGRAHERRRRCMQRFKAATAMSPLQFQKQLRLQEARRLMLVDGLEAATGRAPRRLRKSVAVQPRIPAPVRCAAEARDRGDADGRRIAATRSRGCGGRGADRKEGAATDAMTSRGHGA